MGSKKKTKTEVVETELSKEQVEILKDREQFYQNVTQPALTDYFNATRNFSLNNDFANLNDLTNQLDGIFSSDADQSQLSRDLFRRGFSGEDSAAAEVAAARRGTVGREVQGSQARLAALQQGNQNIIARNQNLATEQNVRQGGIDALLSQAPRPTGSGAPIISQVQTGGGNAWLGALGGALGSGASSLFSGGGSRGGGSIAGFNQGAGGGNLSGNIGGGPNVSAGPAGPSFGAGQGVFR